MMPPLPSRHGRSSVLQVTSPPSYDRIGPLPPDSPVVLSVPHAGRDYPPTLLTALRVPLRRATALEDRRVDAVALAARGERTLIVAHRARAWIDLNRGEDERDPRLDDGARSSPARPLSTKVRGGLGIVPRQVGGVDLWRRRFGADEVQARIIADHRPYHRALGEALLAARARYGIAILLDIHSMPSLGGRDAAQLVVGDRFGTSAATRFTATLETIIRGAGHRVAVNSPYAGGHILERHGAPLANIHAIQLEIDRALYLTAAGDELGAGLPGIVTLVRDIADALTDMALPLATAAE